MDFAELPRVLLLGQHAERPEILFPEAGHETSPPQHWEEIGGLQGRRCLVEIISYTPLSANRKVVPLEELCGRIQAGNLVSRI